tara:strand:+ start:78 stop:536 length:459 start_codon:yes stop_codon:yes gene_type:complete
MIKINTILNNKEWNNYIKNPSIFVEKKVNRINKNFKKYKDNKIFCTLLLSGNNEIKKLNKKFRKKNKSTDVLSFPFYKKSQLKKKLQKDKEIYLGDIIINLNKIKSKKKGMDFKLQFNKLWIHGLVHLFGYKHNKNKDYYKMLKIEKDFLSY